MTFFVNNIINIFPERLEDEVRNQKNRIVALEEKNSFFEGETIELKSLVRNLRTELDYVKNELTKHGNFRNQIPNQYDFSLPHADETFKRNKRPAQLLPLQLSRYDSLLVSSLSKQI